MEKNRGSAERLMGRNVLAMPLFNFKVRFFLIIPVLVLVALATAGCVTKSRADAQARAAFIAGQQAAYQSMGQTQTDVVVLGHVDKHEIPWVTGLTLAQAIATANYTGDHDPTEIMVKRNTVQQQIDPRKLLNGEDMLLQPGDVITVISQ
jgi:hypothetical protein